MSEYRITVGSIELAIGKKGAEIHSLKKNGIEYMWDADPEFWGRTAPVLFPIVGSLKDKKYRYGEKEYSMGQHGFARDLDFDLVEQYEDGFLFGLKESEATLLQYPFPFSLNLEYRIQDNRLVAKWHVTNTGTTDLYFSLGGHPAFLCEYAEEPGWTFQFEKNKKVLSSLLVTRINESGLAKKEKFNVALDEGALAITPEIFLQDALVLEHAQTDAISLIDPTGKKILVFRADTPVYGLWSPAGKNAPFVCIEPWYGRCDAEDSDGDFTRKEWSNCLASCETFTGGYEIEFC